MASVHIITILYKYMYRHNVFTLWYVVEPDSNGVPPRQNSMPTRLSLESPDDTYTKGVDVQQISVTGEQ